jgi:hypothetical protein
MNDDELLEHLRHTLAPPAVSPPPEGLVALHRALVEQGLPSPPKRLLRRRCVIPALTTLIVLGGAAGAMAATGLPEPVRDVAHLIRLPVSDSHRPSMSELVNRLRTDRARGDSHAAERDARNLETLLRQGTSNAADRAEATKALEEEGDGVPQPAGHPAATTTDPSERQSPGTVPPAAPEADSPITQPSSPTPTPEVSESAPIVSQPPSAPTAEPSGADPTTPSTVEP